MDFQTKLNNYAEILVRYGLNIQPGQTLTIKSETCHRDFVVVIAKQAYKAGAKYVQVDFGDPELLKVRIENSDNDSLEFVPGWMAPKYDELVQNNDATLSLVGSENPDILEGLDPKKINIQRMAQYKMLKSFYEEGIGQSKVHWTVAAAATAGWGAKVFVGMTGEPAKMALWDQIFKICRADQDDCVEVWREHDRVLAKRAKSLNDLKIQTLHFTGPGTDLKVGLSEHARFKGGTDVSPRGVPYEPNIPTEECFTTPDYNKTEGFVKATRPFLVNGTLIRNLELIFKEGRVASFKASSGETTFKEYIESDPGASRLGEVALVGIDSPIFQSGLIFEEILYDENAACHIAVGSAYKFCIADGDSMTSEQLNSIGFNESSVHTDMMISSENVDVCAHTFDGKKIDLIAAGKWLSF